MATVQPNWLSTRQIIRLRTLLIIIIIAMGAVLRFYNLGTESLWHDEIATWAFSQQTLAQLWGENAIKETNPPLYYTLQKLWLIFGDSEFAMRSLSATIGILTIPLVYLLGQILGGYWLGIIASALFATSSINIQYSQEARAYNLLTCSATLVMIGIAWLLSHPELAKKPISQSLLSCLRYGFLRTQSSLPDVFTGLAWFAYIAGSIVAFYSHNTSVLLLLPVNGILVLYWLTAGNRNRGFFYNLAISNIIIALVCGWWLSVLLKQTSPGWIKFPTFSAVKLTLTELYAHPWWQNAYPWLQGRLRKLDIVLVFSLTSAGILYWLRQRRHFSIALTLSLVTLPLVLAYVISFKQPIFITRIFVWVTVPFLLILANGILLVRSKIVAIILSIVLLSFQTLDTSFYYQNYKKEPWSTLITYLEKNFTVGDSILVSGIRSQVVSYYAPALRDSVFHIPIRYIGKARFRNIRGEEIRGFPAFLNTIETRLWLVIRERESRDPQNVLLSQVSLDLTKLEHKAFHSSFENIEIFLFEKYRR